MGTIRTGIQSDERGLTLLEVMMVVAILGTLGAMAIMVSPRFVEHARAEAGIAQALDILRSAREVAISQRRNVQVRFIGTDAIQTARVEIDGTTTVLRTIQFENRMEFRFEDGVPNTPDNFPLDPADNPIAFGPSPTRMFTSEGTFVDGTGDVLNGSLFLAIRGQRNSARAITVFGATALLRAWQWDGSQWRE
jgi:prepilin-type N-terminal cleavage/methylation domain-containing protein